MKAFEVAIIGAGPAGSFAAEALSTRGVSVALFDGRPEGEPKACGGGVTSKALKAWPQLMQAVGRTINDIDLYSPTGKHIHLELDEPFAIYSRTAFDTYLRNRAREAGAQVFHEKISARRVTRGSDGWLLRAPDGNEWQCEFLVGADGANSSIARLFLPALPPSEMEVAFGYRAPLPHSGVAATVVAFLPDWIGYAWAFPRVDHISFGIATTQEAFEHGPLDQLLWQFMVGYYRKDADSTAPIWANLANEQESRLRTQLGKTAEKYAARIPGLSPATWTARRACGEGWALLGDAAGFADPVTGEGIYYALRSAELFSESYVRGVPLEYEQRWREDFGRELLRASQMRRRFYGNFWGAPFTERMIEFARGHRGIKRVLGDLIAGDQGYTNLKKKLARSALRPL